MSAELEIERRGAATHLFINRPERANALSAALVERLVEALQIALHDGTRLVVIRGKGKSFCSGFDLTSVDSESGGDLALRFVRIEQLLQLLYHYPVDTVAFAHGRVYGAGADLFCACNHRICAPRTTFRFPGVRFGVLLGTRRLASRVGDAAAGTMVLEGRELDATEAHEAGLATAQLPEEAWDGMVQGLERNLEWIAPQTTRSVLRCLRSDTRDADMASLVASVAEPGFRDRIRAYRTQVSKPRS
jgi:enoyl-CoA hydratase/carnithine racemase